MFSMRASSYAVLLLIASAIPAVTQRRVDLRNNYERLVCVVPLIGAGTPEDPLRPIVRACAQTGPARFARGHLCLLFPTQ
jgi:hypothetical protein